jgi:hypothetical protein
MSNREEDVEILALRHQITVLERHLARTGCGSPRAVRRCWRRYCTDCRVTCGYWRALTRSCAGTATCSPAVTLPLPNRSAQAGRGPCVPSASWYCVWPGRTPAAATGAGPLPSDDLRLQQQPENPAKNWPVILPDELKSMDKDASGFGWFYGLLPRDRGCY